MIRLLWPTIRPSMMKDAYKIWLEKADKPDDISIDIAVNTAKQRNGLLKFNSVIVVGDKHPGAAYATYMLSRNVRLKDTDLVILASDDFIPPKSWDTWAKKQLRDKCACLVVRDGYQVGGAVTIPIMTYGCLRRLNHVIYHPEYYHQYSDAELYEVLRSLGMMIKLRGKEHPLFEHKHWANGKRKLDEYDNICNKKGGVDEKTYQRRQKLPVEKRLIVKGLEMPIAPFATNLKIHRITSMDDIKAHRKVWHPFYDKTGNIEQVFSKWANNNLNYCSLEEADFIYLPIRFVNFFKIYATGQHRPNRSSIDFIIKRFNTKHFRDNSHKYFTICQWVTGPNMDLGNAIKFMATATKDDHIPIPLCTDEHPNQNKEKTLLASFVGNFDTHPLRKRIAKECKLHKQIRATNARENLKLFRGLLNASLFNLCPRGVGPASFRIFESFHVGSVPVIISDNYRRPYGDEVNWDDFSVTIKEKDIGNIKKILYSKKEKVPSMVAKGKKFYKAYCTREMACRRIINKLEKMHE